MVVVSSMVISHGWYQTWCPSRQDPDGSVALAAVLPPRRAAPSVSRPVVVSLSGVGVEPQGQADAYKMKLKAEESRVTSAPTDEFEVVVV